MLAVLSIKPYSNERKLRLSALILGITGFWFDMKLILLKYRKINIQYFHVVYIISNMSYILYLSNCSLMDYP